GHPKGHSRSCPNPRPVQTLGSRCRRVPQRTSSGHSRSDTRRITIYSLQPVQARRLLLGGLAPLVDLSVAVVVDTIATDLALGVRNALVLLRAREVGRD